MAFPTVEHEGHKGHEVWQLAQRDLSAVWRCSDATLRDALADPPSSAGFYRRNHHILYCSMPPGGTIYDVVRHALARGCDPDTALRHNPQNTIFSWVVTHCRDGGSGALAGACFAGMVLAGASLFRKISNNFCGLSVTVSCGGAFTLHVAHAVARLLGEQDAAATFEAFFACMHEGDPSHAWLDGRVAIIRVEKDANARPRAVKALALVTEVLPFWVASAAATVVPPQVLGKLARKLHQYSGSPALAAQWLAACPVSAWRARLPALHFWQNVWA